jgi:hypothetical protein
MLKVLHVRTIVQTWLPPPNRRKRLAVCRSALDVSFTRGDADTINRVAEIDGMQKSARVAERLAVLKAQQAA